MTASPLSNISPGPSPKPMDVGEIIGTAWRLYRSHFLQYLPISLRANAWLMLPTVALIAGLLWVLGQDIALEDIVQWLALLVPAWIVLFLWCNAQSLGEFSAICRLVYQSVRQSFSEPETVRTVEMETTESVADALRFTRSRKFSLLGSAVIQWVVLGAVNFIFWIALSFALGLIFIGLGVPSGNPSPGLFLGGGALFLFSMIVFIWLSLWLSMRFLVTEQSLAIETESGAIASIGRSWKLMKKHVLRALGAVILAGLIALPVLAVVGIASQFVQSIALEAVGAIPSPDTAAQVVFLGMGLSYLIGAFLGILGSIIIAPFFRAVVTTLYFDIRNRKERIEA